MLSLTGIPLYDRPKQEVITETIVIPFDVVPGEGVAATDPA